jgi:hypothetical protein
MVTTLNIGSPANLESVSKRISTAVATFVKRNLYQDFTALELRYYVANQVGPVAPGSPDRIMRSLRQRGVINYELLDRSASLYRGLPIGYNAPAVAQGDGDGTAVVAEAA